MVITPSQSHPMVAVDMYQVSLWHSYRVACPSNIVRVRMLSPTSYRRFHGRGRHLVGRAKNSDGLG